MRGAFVDDVARERGRFGEFGGDGADDLLRRLSFVGGGEAVVAVRVDNDGAVGARECVLGCGPGKRGGEVPGVADIEWDGRVNGGDGSEHIGVECVHARGVGDGFIAELDAGAAGDFVGRYFGGEEKEGVLRKAEVGWARPQSGNTGGGAGVGIPVGAAREGVQVKEGRNASSLQAGTKSNDSRPGQGIDLRDWVDERSACCVCRSEGEMADWEASCSAVEGLGEVGDVGIGEGCRPVILPFLACRRDTVNCD